MSTEFIMGWLPREYDYERPKRGLIRKGTVIQATDDGFLIDIGLKHDGFVPMWDVERLDEETGAEIKPGTEVVARIMRTTTDDGTIAISLYQALSEKDWDKAEELLNDGEMLTAKVIEHNRGGLVVQFGRIQGFIPLSHLWNKPHSGLSPEQRASELNEYVSQELPLQVLEVNRQRRRFILSERLARREMRAKDVERLLEELQVGEVRHGRVRSLAAFGAFVDLGGADGLVHRSELTWKRVRHPSDIVQVGDEVDVYVLNIDRERKRIALSLKRMLPNPWEIAETLYFEGQIVQGKVVNLAEFGAFVAIEGDLEGLIHISELSDPPPSHPSEVVQPGDDVVIRVMSIDSFRERMGLSLKRVDKAERQQWLDEQGLGTEVSIEGERVSDSVEPEVVAESDQVGDSVALEAVAESDQVGDSVEPEAVAESDLVGDSVEPEAVAESDLVGDSVEHGAEHLEEPVATDAFWEDVLVREDADESTGNAA